MATAIPADAPEGATIYRLPKFLETQQRFWRLCELGNPLDPTAICVLGYFGGWGSGKTTIGKWIVFDHLMLYPKLKALVVRDTFSSLNLTTKREFLDRMIEGDPDEKNLADLCKLSWNEQAQLYVARNDSSVLFGGLDRVEKWGSTEFGLILVDEASLTSPGDISFLLSRLRQVSPRCDKCVGVGCAYCDGTGQLWGSTFRRKIILVSNHVNTEHYLYKDFVGSQDQRPKENYFYVETSSWENAPQHGGFLPPGYLESLAKSGDRRMTEVYMGGKWGVIPKGEPVYEWVPTTQKGVAWHEQPCTFDKSRPIFVSFDFGYRFPFATFHQIQARNTWRILGELTMPNSQTRDLCFAARSYIQQRFPSAQVAVCYGDPAGFSQRPEGRPDSETVETIMGAPFRALASTKTSIATRRNSIQTRLAESVAGEPLVAADPVHCPRLCEAFRGMYRFAELKQVFQRTNFIEEPVEEHPYVDVMHSVEYFALNHFGELGSNVAMRLSGQVVEPRYKFR